MCTPYPRPCSPEQGGQDSHKTIILDKLNHGRVRAGVQEELCGSIPVPIQGGNNRGQEVGVGGEHVQYVLQGAGQIGLESLALP